MDTRGQTMEKSIKELRNSTGLTQREFAQKYQIPISTLRKWEQGEASPAKYVISLIAKTLPSTDMNLKKIEGYNGEAYYYDRIKNMVFDSQGNGVSVEEDLDDVKAVNISIYLEETNSGW